MPVKQEPVSVNWQTLFAILPVVQLWAFYRIEKLRLGLLLVIVVNYGIPYLLIFSIATVSQGYGDPAGSEWMIILFYVLAIVVPIRFIRKWSKQWNEKFS